MRSLLDTVPVLHLLREEEKLPVPAEIHSQRGEEPQALAVPPTFAGA